MKYYKVVYKNLQSMVIHDSKYVVQYAVDQWVEPRIGKLFVFDDLETAKNWRMSKDGRRLFEVEVRDPEKVEVLTPIIPSDKDIEDFWKGEGHPSIYHSARNSVFVSAVKLVQEIF